MDRLRINDEDLDKIFDETDVNHDGRLSYDELEVPKIDTIFLFIKKKKKKKKKKYFLIISYKN